MSIDENLWARACMPHRVSYGETDTMGVLYHAEYLHICERARNFLSRQIGFTYKDMENSNLFLPVREANVRYRRPVGYDDLIHVDIGVTEWKKASVRFYYNIYNEEKDTLIAEASTLHACVSKEGKVIAFPDWIKEKFIAIREEK